MEKNNQQPEYPDENFHGYFKAERSQHGFTVSWLNMPKLWYGPGYEQKLKPGIYIQLIRPDNKITEKKFFEFGQEDKAEEEYQIYLRKIKAWDSIKR